MKPQRSLVLLAALVLAACAGTNTGPEPDLIQAASAAYAQRISALVASWEAAGASRTAPPPGWQRSAPGDTVSAAWWGFDPADATAGLQAAIDSGAHTIVVPRTPSPWMISHTLDLGSGGMEILLEAGTVLLALPGAFRDSGEALMQSVGGRDFSILGYGASIRMRKHDYQNPPYEPGEWRHAINLRGVAHVLIAGLSIQRSGGDGIYVGTRAHAPSEDVTLKDLSISDNYRQGISVISARHLRIQNCTISKTSGTAPSAGIDFEPNSHDPGFQDCVVRACRIEGNAGGGILFVLSNLHADSDPVSILVQGCRIGNFPIAMWLHGLGRGVRGSITVSDCSFGGIAWLQGSSDFSVTFEKPQRPRS